MLRTMGVLVLAVALAGCASQAPAKNEFTIAVTDEGFVPTELVIPKNEAVTLVVTRKTDRTCATSMVMDNGERHELPLHKEVRIDLPAGHADTLRYACPMDMYKGVILAK